MKKYTYILFLIVSLINFSYIGYAQDLPIACGGSVERYRVAGDNGNSDFYWEVTGGEILRFFNDSVDIQWGTVAGIRTITVTEKNLYGCEGDPYSQTLMVSSPFVDIGLDEDICSGETYEFVAASSEVTSYLWQDNETTVETFIASTSGDYWVKVTDENGCAFTDTATLIVHDLPFVDLGPDTTLCSAEESIEFEVSDDINYVYEWSDEFALNTPIYSASFTGSKQEIWVKVTDQFGCVGSDTVLVGLCEIAIPNTITPNDDNYNDTWVIEALYGYDNVTVDIYNRWGERVYHSKKYEEPWDGRNLKGKKLPMDSYYYVIDLHNGEEPIVGTVTIIR